MVLYVTLGLATIRVILESDLGSIAMTALRKDIYIYIYVYIYMYLFISLMLLTGKIMV